jgi:inorganic pyrophosphatase
LRSWEASARLEGVKATPPDLPVAFVEIPKGSRNKYEYDARLERVVLDRTLYASVVYPCDYGFLMETLGEDGDPLDTLVLVTAPTFPGCLIPCRPVGVLEMHDEAGPDEKILCVPHDDPTWTRVSDASDVRPELLAEIKHFFEVYKDLEEGKHVTVGEWEGREQAVEAWGRGHERWRQAGAGSA